MLLESDFISYFRSRYLQSQVKEAGSRKPRETNIYQLGKGPKPKSRPCSGPAKLFRLPANGVIRANIYQHIKSNTGLDFWNFSRAVPLPSCLMGGLCLFGKLFSSKKKAPAPVSPIIVTFYACSSSLCLCLCLCAEQRDPPFLFSWVILSFSSISQRQESPGGFSFDPCFDP